MFVCYDAINVVSFVIVVVGKGSESDLACCSPPCSDRSFVFDLATQKLYVRSKEFVLVRAIGTTYCRRLCASLSCFDDRLFLYVQSKDASVLCLGRILEFRAYGSLNSLRSIYSLKKIRSCTCD